MPSHFSQTVYKLTHQARINVCDKSFLQSMFPHAFETKWLLYRDKAITSRCTNKHTQVFGSESREWGWSFAAWTYAKRTLMSQISYSISCPDPWPYFHFDKKKKKKSLNDLTCIVIKWSHHFALQIVPAPIVTLRFNHTPELWIVLCCGVSSCWSFPQLKYFSNYYMFISKHQRKSLLLYLNMKQWYLKKNKNFREGKRDSGDQISLTVFV